MKFILMLLLFVSGVLIHTERSGNKTPPAVDPNDGSMPIFCKPGFDPTVLTAEKAPLFKGLGNLHYPITTRSSRAQQYFNQGLTLLYAFNHNEAGRSFKVALNLDSTCAMAYWGMAMVLGPNYNAALNPTSLGQINEVMDKAVFYASRTSPREQALIRALRLRFPVGEVTDMTPYNQAYAAAMKQAWLQFPEDVQIGALYADALMNEHPWNLWLRDGAAQPWTPEIMEVLEGLMAKAPDHPGINHFYIHAVEASRQPGKGLAAADRLRDLLPGAGHLVHMPSHIYIRTGDYHKGVIANQKASLADSNYVTQCRAQGFYAMLLYPHNIHFLAACAFLEGNSKTALDAAWKVADKADKKYIQQNVTLQHYSIIPFHVMVHLGKWTQILQQPKPATGRYPLGVWHYARGEAFAATGNLPKARAELARLQEIARDPNSGSLLIWETNSAAQLLSIADHVLSADILVQEGQYNEAIERLRQAVKLEDALLYQEPPDWFFSVRHSLGHALLKAGRFSEAQNIYEEDLIQLPENGWSLMGLYNSLTGQKKLAEAAAVKKRFEKAWQWSDIRIVSSRIY